MKNLRDHQVHQRNIIETVERLIKDYTDGKIGRKEIKSRLNLIHEAAQIGLVHAETFLAHIFDCGIGVRKDLSKAVFWYEIAARHNDVHAQSWLGYAYGNGIGVTKNLAKALFWDRKA